MCLTEMDMDQLYLGLAVAGAAAVAGIAPVVGGISLLATKSAPERRFLELWRGMFAPLRSDLGLEVARF